MTMQSINRINAVRPSRPGRSSARSRSASSCGSSASGTACSARWASRSFSGCCSARACSENKLDYAHFFPGTLVMILLFTAIFATISIIEDRREGFLQGVLVAPVPRWAMVLGKVLGGAAIAMLQGIVFLAARLARRRTRLVRRHRPRRRLASSRPSC